MITPGAILSAPWEALAFCLLLLVAPVIVSQQRSHVWQLAGLIAALIVTLFSPTPGLAYVAVAAAAAVHAVAAAPTSRTGAATLAVSALLALAAAAATRLDALTAAFVLSCLAIACRAGALPFHAGVASLCDRNPVVQTQQLASTIALVFVHLRFVGHHAGAIELAPAIVRYGAAVAVAAALLTVVQRDLRGLYRGTTTMHGGMLLAALGAASLDNFAAALLVAVAMGLALGGLGLVIVSLEERVGPVAFADGGGRIRAFPRLGAAFALFGGAGVGLPGTAGFVADDLLLHTLWKESPTSAVAMVIASALLAVATLRGYSKVFLGRPVVSVAPDLSRRERIVAVALVLLLLILGFAPRTLLGPADAFLERTLPDHLDLAADAMMGMRSWCQLRLAMLRMVRSDRGSGHPAWIAFWLAASAALVLCTPEEFGRTVRITRGSVQRPDRDDARHGAGPEGDIVSSIPPAPAGAPARIERSSGVDRSPIAAVPATRPVLQSGGPEPLFPIPLGPGFSSRETFLRPPGRAPPPAGSTNARCPVFSVPASS